MLIILFGFLPVKGQNILKRLEPFDTVEVSNKTKKDIDSAFEIVKNAPIFFKNKKQIANNCENRSQFVYLVLEKLGFKPVNFWLFKEGLVENKYTTTSDVKKSIGLTYNTKIGRKPNVFWGYHVATGVIVNDDDKKKIYIFDPWTQDVLVSLKAWSLSFFGTQTNRTAYVLPVNGLYKYYGTKELGQVSLLKDKWQENLDESKNQMYCGLAGITPNHKCEKKRFRRKILNKKVEIELYLKNYGISLK